MKSTTGCVEAAKEGLKKRDKKLVKMCGTKYGRGGNGCN